MSVSVPSAGRTTSPAPGVGLDVVVGAAVVAVGLLPALFLLPHAHLAVDAGLPVLGWFPLGMAGVILLDRRGATGPAVGSLVASLAPLVPLGWCVARSAPDLDAAGIDAALAALGPWWLLPALAVGIGAACGTGSRAARRWAAWMVLASLSVVVTGAATWVLADERTYGAATTIALLGLAAVVATSALGSDPRPVDEPLLDVGLVLATAAAALVTGGLLGVFATSQRIFGAEVVGAFGAAAAVALAVPTALRVRRDVLTRRYGSGALSPDDVAALTADLSGDPDPRRLLDKAASLVSLASGSPAVRISLDDEVEAGWTAHELVVGLDRVGTLLVRYDDAEGPEVKQARAIQQLVPTVALAARAVTLAVDAGHARTDVLQQRAAERARILADLHDDLGPVLAGMSMRVQAARSTEPAGPTSELLATLADDLAACRSDLRRIVAGLTPSALADADAGTAVRALVASYSSSGPEVRVAGDVPDGIADDLAVVLYRCVAEGVTNALRHARPDHVTVRIERTAGALVVTVSDDGGGGVVVPGVGLTSLRARAAELGGTLDVRSDTTGATLELRLPEEQQ